MARVGAKSEKQKQILRYAQDDNETAKAGPFAKLRAGSSASPQDDVRRQFGETFLLNDRVNQMLIENLDEGAWREKPEGNVRTIAAIFSHMHNVRLKWVRLSHPTDEELFPHSTKRRLSGPPAHLKAPAQLSWARSTQEQAGTGRPGTRASRKDMAAALKESALLCATMLEDKRVTQFVRDGWARPWNVESASGAAAMLTYMVSHEAHHRGQVCMLAHQMGYRLPMKVMAKMWDWKGSF